MSKAISLPPEQQEALITLLGLGRDKQELLLGQISESVLVLNPNKLLDQLVERVEVGEDDLEKILSLLFGLYVLMDGFNESPEVVAGDLIKAMRGDEQLNEVTETEFADFEGYVTNLLSAHSTFGVSAKAARIITQHEHVFLRSEIYIDIRAVFGTRGSGLDPRAVVLVHMLKIEHREERRFKSAFFALDHNDLLQLQETVERAIKKHDALSKLVGGVALSVLDPEED